MKKTLAMVALSLTLSANMHNMHKMHGHLFQTVDESKATIVQKGKDARHCANCGMDLVKWYKTSHAAKVNSKIKQYCSLHCLAEDIIHNKHPKNMKVVDTKSLKFIDAKKAYYVVGSNVRGTMSKVSKYAFKNKIDAQNFQKKHGGEIMTFKEALEVAKKDFSKN